jgi:hypothetical protein
MSVIDLLKQLHIQTNTLDNDFKTLANRQDRRVLSEKQNKQDGL